MREWEGQEKKARRWKSSWGLLGSNTTAENGATSLWQLTEVSEKLQFAWKLSGKWRMAGPVLSLSPASSPNFNWKTGRHEYKGPVSVHLKYKLPFAALPSCPLPPREWNWAKLWDHLTCNSTINETTVHSRHTGWGESEDKTSKRRLNNTTRGEASREKLFPHSSQTQFLNFTRPCASCRERAGDSESFLYEDILSSEEETGKNNTGWNVIIIISKSDPLLHFCSWLVSLLLLVTSVTCLHLHSHSTLSLSLATLPVAIIIISISILITTYSLSPLFFSPPFIFIFPSHGLLKSNGKFRRLLLPKT